MQTVIMSVVNSGNDNKTYRVNDLDFNIVGGQTKNVTISLPDDAGFIVWLTGESDLTGTITYGQNDPSTVMIVDEDYAVDPLDGTVILTATVPWEILLPSIDTMFSGDSDGGVGSIIQLKRASSGVLKVQTTSPDTIDGNAHIAGVAGYLSGGTGADGTFGNWTSITDGEFAGTFDNVALDILGIDFSATHHSGVAVASMNDVADRIQEVLRAATGNTETVVWSTNKFVITSSVAKVSGNVSLLTAVGGGAGTDISGAGTGYMDADTTGTAVSAVAGIGGYAFVAAGSIHMQAVRGGWQTVGGTTAFA